VVGVALDISNAFNSLSWDRIGRALKLHRVSPYLRRILRDYLSDWWLEYRDHSSVPVQRGVCRGVSQGSVLGPHLRNLGYNAVLSEVLLPPGCDVVCYADDTLILAAGKDWGEARSRANEATAGVVRRIRDLGLEVAPQKTEAIYFHNGRRGASPNDSVEVSGVPVPIGAQLKYLGLTLDSRWNFRTHFNILAPAREEGGGRYRLVAPKFRGAQRASPPSVCGGGPLHSPIRGSSMGRRGGGLPAYLHPVTWGAAPSGNQAYKGI